MRLNNEGVIATNAGNFDLAIVKLKTAMKLDPKYMLAAQNLSTAYNNYGLKFGKDHAANALEQFHKAVFYDPTAPNAASNLDTILLHLGKNPKSFEDRALLGDQAQASKDFIGAVIEYEAALAIKDDPAVKKKLTAVAILAGPRPLAKQFETFFRTLEYSKVVQSKMGERWLRDHKSKSGPTIKMKIAQTGLVSSTEVVKSSGNAELDKQAVVVVNACAPYDAPPEDGTEVVYRFDSVDYGPYMNDLQRQIKSAWAPPKGQYSGQVVVVFKVHKGGEVSHIKITHSSGLPLVDEAAMKALQKAAPFKPLPEGALSDVDVEFAFNRNFIGITKSGANIGTSLNEEIKEANGDNSKLVAIFNNHGIRALNAGQYDLAIAKFLAVLKLKPDDAASKNNLSNAFYKYAQKVSDKEALPIFRCSLFLNPYNTSARDGLQKALAALNIPSRSFEEHVSLAEQESAGQNDLGAYVEYTEALRLHSDDAVKQKADHLYTSALKQLYATVVPALPGSPIRTAP